MNQVDEHIITDRFLSVRKYSEEICAPLEKEDYVVQPSVDVSPPKWHLAHITWFWEEFVLAKYFKGYKRFHPRYAFLFNSYYNAVGDRVLRLDRGNMSRPTVAEILAYRQYVDDHMVQLLKNTSEDLASLIELGINHEQQHQELLFTDIKFILGHNPLFPPYKKDFTEGGNTNSKVGYVELPGGKHEIGFKGLGFYFDNECKTHKVLLNDFSIRQSLVSNAEYLEFMNSGAYENAKYWHSDAWDWINKNDIHAPLYWYKIDGEWYRYALSGLEKIKPDEPVTHISFYEAAAYAEWSGHRLPTEFEWEAASNYFDWGVRWEHTNSAYLPYPGFEKPAGAIGEYNGKFMVNQMVLRGASIVTPAGHSRKTYRNFFHPQLRWQFNGIRLCKR